MRQDEIGAVGCNSGKHVSRSLLKGSDGGMALRTMEVEGWRKERLERKRWIGDM